ncbi:MAG: protein phosphatase 2C domain-containing protein [Firmicutes bacterium]|nr:protein phosphatase 2C domain-containing protein [Bacillota bacterium]
MGLHSFGISDTGRERAENQDRFYRDDRSGLYIVADGMGGMRDGAAASRYVVEAVLGLWKQAGNRLNAGAANGPEFFREIVKRASNDLYAAMQGMAGSTAVLAWVADRRGIVANLGDSPAYLYRGGGLILLSEEHTVAKLLVEMGKLAPAAAMAHPARGQLTAFVGMRPEPPVFIKEISLQAGDRLLLCTDGLTGMIVEAEIARILKAEPTLETAGRRLVEAANLAGGSDNITALLIGIE